MIQLTVTDLKHKEIRHLEKEPTTTKKNTEESDVQKLEEFSSQAQQ